MPVEMGIWRIDSGTPRRLNAARLPSEAALEDYLEQDPSLLGTRLLVIGRQVPTAHGKFIDLLAMDDEGNLHVLELKRDRTPRDVVAQVLDYASWVSTLDRESVLEIANHHLTRSARGPFESAFADVFGGSAPDEVNADLRLTIVATELDPSSERIVAYLRTFGVPVNVVFFKFLEDDGRNYLARSWLSTNEDDAAAPAARERRGKRAEWNGIDWFVSFGDYLDRTERGSGRSWEDARRYGFVSAGGGPWYSRTLRSLPEGARINVHIPGAGYVAVGTTLGEAKPFEEARVLIGGQWERLSDQQLSGSYVHATTGESVPEDDAEHIVPVRWFRAESTRDAFWEKGMFANQNSACKLRQEFTLHRLAEHFDLDEVAE